MVLQNCGTFKMNLMIVYTLKKIWRWGSRTRIFMDLSDESDYQYIFEMDADFSHNPDDLIKLYNACDV